MEKTFTNPDAENPHHDLSKLPMKERLAKWKEQKGKAAATKEPTAKSALHPKSVNNAFQSKAEVELRPKKAVRSAESRTSSKVSANSLNSKPTASLTKLDRAVERGKEQQVTRPLREADSSIFLTSRMTTIATPQKPGGSEAFIFESPSSSTSSPRFGSSTMNDLHEDLYRLLDAGPSEKENEASGRNAVVSKMHPKTFDAAMATSTHEKHIRDLESELQSKRRAIESLTVRASSERAELISQHAADKEAYERTIRETETMMTDLRAQLTANRTQLLRVSEERSTSLLQITSLQSLVSEKESQIVDLTRRLDEQFELRVPKLELELAMEDRNNIATELEETKKLLEECKACLEELELRETRIADLELELVRKEGTIEELEGRLAKSAADAAKMMGEEARATELQIAVEDLIEENEMLHAQNKELVAEQASRAQQLEQTETAENTAKQTKLVNDTTSEETAASKRQYTLLPAMQTPHRQNTFTSRGVQTDIELEKLIEEAESTINQYSMIQAENCIMVQRMNQDRGKYEAEVTKGRIEKAEAEKTWKDLLSSTVDMREKTLQCLALSVQKNQEAEKLLQDERRRADELAGQIRHLENGESSHDTLTQVEPEGE